MEEKQNSHKIKVKTGLGTWNAEDTRAEQLFQGKYNVQIQFLTRRQKTNVSIVRQNQRKRRRESKKDRLQRKLTIS